MSEDSAAKSIQLLADQGYPPNAINNRRMDNPATAIESDDSERWEDFFGSSTDISPSVIDYYDRLSGNCEPLVNKIQTLSAADHTSSNGQSDENHSITATSTPRSGVRSPTSDPPAMTPKKSFVFLSANVQRMIANSTENICEPSSAAPINPFSTATIKQVSPKRIVKHKTQTQLPLSRNTSKLTLAGNEMVDAYESALEHSSSSESLHKSASNTCSGYFGSDTVTDSEKTPTNFDQNQSFIYSRSFAQNHSHKELTNETGNVNASDPPLPLEISPIIVKDSDSSDDLYEDCINEAINFMVNVPEALQSKKQASLQKLTTISERKRIQIAATDSSSIPTNGGLTSDSTANNQNNAPQSDGPKSQPTSLVALPDIARLKPHHRPLSASSISSTTSSSSSGSEHLTNKLGVSYLASVESLADHSENESASHPSLTLCERACLEIIDSERSYVDDLGQVIEGYLEDWKERACLNLNQLQILFSNIQDVFEFNSMFLKELQDFGTDPVKIAECFLNQRNKFEAYTVYCTSYPEAISLLTSLLQASHTNALLTSTQKMLRHRLPLGSYLLKPVQRILKYHLLLENLRKHCEANETVTQAHVLMKEVARNIDQVKRNREQSSRVKELSGILDGWLGPELTVLGDLKLEGLLMEHNKPRVVLLFQTMLIVTKKKEDNRLQFKTYIHGNHLMLIEHLPGEPNSFNVIPYNDPHPTQIKLTARNRDQKRQWAQHIKQVMLEPFDIPSRAKELVFQLGDEEDRTPDKNTWKWPNNTSTTPEYLERRNQGRRSEMRYRSSKKLRKSPLTTSVSLGGFNSHNNNNNNTNDGLTNKNENRKLSAGNSLETLPVTTTSRPNLKPHCEQHRGEECRCELVKVELSNTLAAKNKEDERKMSVISGASLKSSRSMAGDFGSSKFLATSRAHSDHQATEIKMYNTKTLPKRIANIKKQRAKTAAKETFKFYMDFPDTVEPETTVLRITESIENLSVDDESQEPKKDDANGSPDVVQPADKVDNKEADTAETNDVSIIFDLLKDKHVEFDRILKRPPKKKSFDNGKIDTHLMAIPEFKAKPEDANRLETFPMKPPKDAPICEPIYESLLRNVHVPYKFSPILRRSISHQHYRFRKPAAPLPPEDDQQGPDEDYVTLEYTESGQLKSVDGFKVMGKQRPSMMRSSDTNINYTSAAKRFPEVEAGDTFMRQSSLGLMTSSAPIAFDSPVTKMSSSLTQLQHRKSMDCSHRKKIGKLSNRRVSDAADVRFQRVMHKQGSESLGSRIAHLDYADPRTLFASGSHGNILINRQSIQNCERTPSGGLVQPPFSSIGDSFYEQSVEDLLENNGLTVDITAANNIYEVPNEVATLSPKPAIPAKPSHFPPPLPAKTPKEPKSITSPEASAMSAQSWVHKQIRNFET